MNTTKVPPSTSGKSKPSFAWTRNFKARAEEENWSNEDVLNSQTTHNRLLHLQAIGWIVWTFMWCFSAIFLFSLIAWAIHQIAPVCLGAFDGSDFKCSVRIHWLTPEQLSKIQSVIFSGALGSLVTAGANKFVLSKQNE